MISRSEGTAKEPNIIRGGTPYLSHCDATYVAPPAGGNAVDVLSVEPSSISYAYMAGPMAGPIGV